MRQESERALDRIGPSFVKRTILLSTLASAVAVALCLALPGTPQTGGGRSLEGWWAVQALVAVGVATVGSRLVGFPPFLTATFVLGCAGQLAITWPRWLQFIEMRPEALQTLPAGLAVAALLLQTLVVLRGVVTARRDFVEALRGLIGVRTAVFLTLALILAGAHLSVFLGGFPEPFFVVGYLAQLLAAAGFAAVNLAHLWLLVRGLSGDAAQRLVDALRRKVSLPGDGLEVRSRDSAVAPCLAGLSFALSLFLAVFVFERMPHVQDEAAFLFQARQLAGFDASTPAPAAEIDAHSYYLIDTYEGRWHATTKPGWPAVLALGVLAGAPWIVNPLLGALSVLLLHALTLQLTRDRGTAHLVALLTATSPWHLFLASSMMGHTLPLVLTAAGFLAVGRALESDRWTWALAGGLAFGVGVLVRPVDGLVVGTVAGLWILVERRLRLRLLIPFAVGCVAGTLPILPYNRAVTGSPLADPMQAYLDRIWFPGANRLGFGDDIGPPGGWGNLDLRPGHDLFEVLINANQNLYNIHFELLGWSYLSLLPLVAYFCWSERDELDRRLLVYTALLLGVLSVYWFSGGPDFGARYWFLAFIPIVLWSARGLRRIVERLAIDGARTGAAIGLLTITSLCVFVPWRAVGRYVEYRDVHADYRRLLESGELGRAVVLVEAMGESELESALLLNDPSLPDDLPIFVRGDADLEALRQAYPDRPMLRLRGRQRPTDRVERLGSEQHDLID